MPRRTTQYSQSLAILSAVETTKLTVELFKIFENTNYVSLVAKSVSEIIYNKNVLDVSVAITDLHQGSERKTLCKSTDINKTLIKIQDMCRVMLPKCSFIPSY